MEVGVTSTGHIEYHLRCMRDEGIISHEPRKSRGITLLRKPEPTTPIMLPQVRVRLAGLIAAGTAIEANEQLDEYVDLTEGLPVGDVFALRVKGTSMIEDHIADGDIVIIRRQTYADNGDTVVALLNSDTTPQGEATLKRFYKEKDGRVRLQPRNPDLKAMLFEADALVIQGKVVAVIRQI
jgi:repressor LexA